MNALFYFLSFRNGSLRAVRLNAGALRWDWRLQIGSLLLQLLQAFADPCFESLLEGRAAFLFEVLQLGCQPLDRACDAFRYAAVTFLEEGVHLKLLNLLKGLFGSRAGGRFERLFRSALQLEFQRGNEGTGLERDGFSSALTESRLHFLFGLFEHLRYFRGCGRFDQGRLLN